jgi:hypothetical protein
VSDTHAYWVSESNKRKDQEEREKSRSSPCLSGRPYPPPVHTLRRSAQRVMHVPITFLSFIPRVEIDRNEEGGSCHQGKAGNSDGEVKALVVKLVPIPREFSSTSSDDDLLKRETSTDATELAQAEDRPEHRALHSGVLVVVLLDRVLSRDERLHRLGKEGRDGVQDLSDGCGGDERETGGSKEGDDCRNKSRTEREEAQGQGQVKSRAQTGQTDRTTGTNP